MGGRRRVHGGQRVTRRRFTGRLSLKLWYDEFRAEEHFPSEPGRARERSLSEISPVNIRPRKFFFDVQVDESVSNPFARLLDLRWYIDEYVKRMALNIMELTVGELSVDVTILSGEFQLGCYTRSRLEGTYGKVLPRQRKFWIRVERIVKDVCETANWQGLERS